MLFYIALEPFLPGTIMIFSAELPTRLLRAVFGDHCSPISDTTVLSSIACKFGIYRYTAFRFEVAVICKIMLRRNYHMQ